MDKWEKTALLIILISIGVLVIGYLFGADLRGLLVAVLIIDILIALETATKDMKSKWKAFGIRILIMFFITIILGSLFGVSDEAVMRLFTIILFFDLIQTATKKKAK